MVTGKGLKQVIKELIWDPLGIESTYFGLEDTKKAQQDFATGYNWDNMTAKHNKVTYMTLTDLTGSAAVISNVRDYTKDIYAPRVVESLYAGKYYQSLFQGRIIYRHYSNVVGFKSQVYWFPKEKYRFVLFANAQLGHSANDPVAWKLIANKFNIPEKEILPSNRDGQETPEQQFEKAVTKAYPNHTTCDPSFSMKDIEGTYFNQGYSTFTLRSELSKSNETTLITERPEMTWDYAFRFRHVFGDAWMACEEWLANRDKYSDFHPAEFVKGEMESRS
ncbi:Beta-lactamase/transpeptidase-like protein [Metarhizium guizhouense ARSEF 977]|uniref:Beta-lactamase/transpeptidase-like protein n=1 Tax=Metarhizium guizhouense (strain ARSEF 977) TaxID=1276136 RepID=A0A0B4G4Q7_METGA|nr:Beta-lactamase/transpeptidase-like protein [Metarhizium guizhouense ARSEF 977]